jgi:VacB/RNase II family 3'-5' exoribonuclease
LQQIHGIFPVATAAVVESRWGMNNGQIDLKAIARQAMMQEGFHPDFPAEVLNEARAPKPPTPANNVPAPRDLRALAWSSIDNDSSRDLDQVEYVEKLADGTVRLLVGVADVDAMVPKGSATDKRAGTETTTVYTGVAIFPMLPDELSTGKTSLLGGEERVAMVIELRITTGGDVSCHDVYPATLCNRSKLAYSSTGAWLEGKGPLPPAAAAVPGMDAQLRLQHETAEKLRAVRIQKGMLTFSSIEATPEVVNGQVKDLVVAPHNVAENLIEDFMVSANVAMAEYLREKGALSLRRVVKTPKRWDRIQVVAAQYGVKLPAVPDSKALADFLEQRKQADLAHFPDLSLTVVKLLGPGEYIVEPPGGEQEGHFGLAVHDYTHTTAPNRRFADLVTQRILKAACGGAAGPYSMEELGAIAAHCTEREDAARKVERTMRKVAAASLLSGRIGEEFDAIITGVSPKGTFARLLKIPAEGMVVRGAQGADVGDAVRVRLASVNVAKGFIDFERQAKPAPTK